MWERTNKWGQKRRKLLLTCVLRSNSRLVSTIENTACDLELSAFVWVAATVRDLFPSDMRSEISLKERTASLERPSTYGPRVLCSLTLRVCLPLETERGLINGWEHTYWQSYFILVVQEPQYSDVCITAGFIESATLSIKSTIHRKRKLVLCAFCSMEARVEPPCGVLHPCACRLLTCDSLKLSLKLMASVNQCERFWILPTKVCWLRCMRQ